MNRESFNPQVGDFVRIREWFDMLEEFGGNEERIDCQFGFYNGDMRKCLCGLEFEITKIEYTFRGSVKYNGHGTGYLISKDMLEPVDDTTFDTEEIESFFSEIVVR